MKLVESYSDNFISVNLLEIEPYYLVTFSWSCLPYIKSNLCLSLVQAIELYNLCISKSIDKIEVS